MPDGPVEIFCTCPESRTTDAASYVRLVTEAARWSEAAGCTGILVYSENGLVDPWLVAQLIVEATDHLIPLVAVQPLYMNPYAVAKMVTSLAFLHERRVALNLVAGGFTNDLAQLGDETPHDERYTRLTEYGQIIRKLLNGGSPLTHDGRFYRTHELRLQPQIDRELMPTFMVSGSSPAGAAAAAMLDAIAVRYPQPLGQEQTFDPAVRNGIRIGIIVRDDAEEAWRVAYERFPEDRNGQITHQLAMGVSDSHWHAQLSRLAAAAAEQDSPYWLGPFQNYRTFCPYLVGDYETVARALAGYSCAGFGTFVVDISLCPADIESVVRAFSLAGVLAR